MTLFKVQTVRLCRNLLISYLKPPVKSLSRMCYTGIRNMCWSKLLFFICWLNVLLFIANKAIKFERGKSYCLEATTKWLHVGADREQPSHMWVLNLASDSSAKNRSILVACKINRHATHALIAIVWIITGCIIDVKVNDLALSRSRLSINHFYIFILFSSFHVVLVFSSLASCARKWKLFVRLSLLAQREKKKRKKKCILFID